MTARSLSAVYRMARDPDVLADFGAWLQDRTGPFFVWLHFLDPHRPYEARPTSEHPHTSSDGSHPGAESGAHAETASLQDLARLRQLYDGEVSFVDQLFGLALAYLKELDLLENTVVVVTSDHGEEFGEHGEFGHKQIYQETVRVPMLICRARGVMGWRTSIPVGNLDLLPTLAGISGIPHQPVDGVDWARAAEPGRMLVSIAMTQADRQMIGAIAGSEKLIVHYTPVPEMELFDLADDPRETRDVASSRKERVHALLAELTRVVGGDPCEEIAAALSGVDPTEKLDSETRRNLKTLGYLEDRPRGEPTAAKHLLRGHPASYGRTCFRDWAGVPRGNSTGPSFARLPWAHALSTAEPALPTRVGDARRREGGQRVG